MLLDTGNHVSYQRRADGSLDVWRLGLEDLRRESCFVWSLLEYAFLGIAYCGHVLSVGQSNRHRVYGQISCLLSYDAVGLCLLYSSWNCDWNGIWLIVHRRSWSFQTYCRSAG